MLQLLLNFVHDSKLQTIVKPNNYDKAQNYGEKKG